MLSTKSALCLSLALVCFMPQMAYSQNTANSNSNSGSYFTLKKSFFGRGKQVSVATGSGNALGFKENFWGFKHLTAQVHNNNVSYNQGLFSDKVTANSQLGDSLSINRPFHRLTFVNVNFTGLNNKIKSVLNSNNSKNP